MANAAPKGRQRGGDGGMTIRKPRLGQTKTQKKRGRGFPYMASQCPRNDRRGVEMLSPALALRIACSDCASLVPPLGPGQLLGWGHTFRAPSLCTSCNAPQGDLSLTQCADNHNSRYEYQQDCAFHCAFPNWHVRLVIGCHSTCPHAGPSKCERRDPIRVSALRACHCTLARLSLHARDL
jgi:hypothetical protein